MKNQLSVFVAGLLTVSVVGIGCSPKMQAGGAETHADQSWPARVARAAAAFPTVPLNGCTQRIEKPLLLSRAGAGAPLTAMRFCLAFGNDDAIRDYEPAIREAWQTKAVEGASHIVLFEPSEQRAPVVLGEQVTAGQIAGRAVVFSTDGAPDCELNVSASGPALAAANGADTAETVAQKALCLSLANQVLKSLAQGRRSTPSP